MTSKTLTNKNNDIFPEGSRVISNESKKESIHEHNTISSNEINQNVVYVEEKSDIKNIFEEINRLRRSSNNKSSDDQSIEEILSEAEKLLQQSEKEYGLETNVDENRKITKTDNSNGLKSREESKLKTEQKMSEKTSKMPGGAKDDAKGSAISSPSKVSNIYDMKQTLVKKSGSFIKDTSSPRNPDNGVENNRDCKAVVVLREELKDTNEKLKSLQLQYDSLVESGKQTKLGNDNLSKAKLTLEAKIIERDAFLDRMRKELETLKSFKNQFDSNEEKLKQEIAKLKDEKLLCSTQASKDKIMIQDLQRQCKEMEGILARRHPDSVSALIVTSKNSPADLSAKELLEKRISFLQNELKEQEMKYQQILSSVQDKVNGMKENYETHISDLEKQVVTLQHIISQSKQTGKVDKVCEVTTQTEATAVSTVQTQVVKPSVNKNLKQQPLTTSMAIPTNAIAISQSQLLATIRGLNSTLSQKEKTIMKMSRDLHESKRLVSKYQKEREINLKAHSVEKIANRRPATSRPVSVRTKESRENIIKNTPGNKEDESKEEAFSLALKKDLSTLQSDYEKLKKKRIEDLYALQAAHEKELMNFNMKVMPLQEDIERLNTTIDLLKNQTKDTEDQMSLLVVERDQYKNKVEIMSSRLNSFSDFGSERSMSSNRKGGDRDYDFLKKKVCELEKRYEGRELRLKVLIDSLAKLKNSQTISPRVKSGQTDDVILPGSYLPF